MFNAIALTSVGPAPFQSAKTPSSPTTQLDQLMRFHLFIYCLASNSTSSNNAIRPTNALSFIYLLFFFCWGWRGQSSIGNAELQSKSNKSQ
jgi:hypothetical protein